MKQATALREQPEPRTGAEEVEAPRCPVCGDQLRCIEDDPTYQRRWGLCGCGVAVSWPAEIAQVECAQETADTEPVPGAMVLALPLPDDVAEARGGWERKLKRERQRRWRQRRKVKVIASLM